jgi:hypothetical protein
VTVNIDGADTPGNYGIGGPYFADRRVTQIGGKQAVTFWDTKKSQYDVYLSPYNDINRAGNLHIQVEARPPRGNLSSDAAITVPLDRGKAQVAEPHRNTFPNHPKDWGVRSVAGFAGKAPSRGSAVQLPQLRSARAPSAAAATATVLTNSGQPSP